MQMNIKIPLNQLCADYDPIATQLISLRDEKNERELLTRTSMTLGDKWHARRAPLPNALLRVHFTWCSAGDARSERGLRKAVPMSPIRTGVTSTLQCHILSSPAAITPRSQPPIKDRYGLDPDGPALQLFFTSDKFIHQTEVLGLQSCKPLARPFTKFLFF